MNPEEEIALWNSFIERLTGAKGDFDKMDANSRWPNILEKLDFNDIEAGMLLSKIKEKKGADSSSSGGSRDGSPLRKRQRVDPGAPSPSSWSWWNPFSWLRNTDFVIEDLSAGWKALLAQTLGGAGTVLRLPGSTKFPLPQDNSVLAVFVRQCYLDWFALFMTAVEANPIGKFALSGTPGIGKTLSALVLLLKIKSVDQLKNRPILYQHAEKFYLYDPSGVVSFVTMTRATDLARKSDTFYIIDGEHARPLDSACLVLFIASPRNKNFKTWWIHNMTPPWYLPVWTLDELQRCAANCYPRMKDETLMELFRKYGGVARYVFWSQFVLLDDNAPPSIDSAISDADALVSIRAVGEPSQVFPTSHMLLHIVVDKLLRFRHVELASDFVGVLLFKKYYDGTLERLRSMLGPGGALAGHLFECYGHYVFEHGDVELEMRSLEDGKAGVLILPKRSVVFFDEKSLPTELEKSKYYQPLSPSFPAVDALICDGMPQFTVSANHPVIGVRMLSKLVHLYSKGEGKARLLHVVPDKIYDDFKKQPYKSKNGQSVSTDFYPPVDQYVVKLTVGISPSSLKLCSK